MKADLDRLMNERHLDAILVVGAAMHNPPMVYFTGVAHVSDAILVKKRGNEAILFHRDMERGEAERSGLRLKRFEDYPMREWHRELGGDFAKARARLYHEALLEAGVTHGRVAVYGAVDAGAAWAILNHLKSLAPGLEIVGETGDHLIKKAMLTKDEQEMARIRHMGMITIEVVGRTAEFLSSQVVMNEMLTHPDGKPVTIGDVKRRIDLWLAELGAENPEGTIFASGVDAALPHSSGDDAAPLRLGQTIVFDIFPCEKGGGYYYDFTRTWCLGYATDEALAVYEQVRQIYDTVVRELRMGARCSDYQRRAWDLFEKQGHPTQHSEPGTQRGYVHGLGHGVGLYVHERPSFSVDEDLGDTLTPGAVFTIEPGLYYPEKGLGVRLEDTYLANPDGTFERLAEYPYDLVLPVRH
jgi:Xaa-Pro aminopeptidase